MNKTEALKHLDAALKTFADEKNNAAHLVRVKLQSARDHVAANWSDEKKPDAKPEPKP